MNRIIPATPLMQQYHELKAVHTDALLFFQVGDFYELFYDDAKKAAAYLGITLTARGKNNGEPIPLCGVPVHTKDHYIAKLIKGGFRVALCDQLEPATPGVVVKRGVTQVFTPATLTDLHMLDEKKASYLFSCFPDEGGCGLLFGELLTSQIQATSARIAPERVVTDEVARLLPDEIILPNTHSGKIYATRLKAQGYHASLIDTVDLSDEYLYNWLNQQFGDQIARSVMQDTFLHGAVRYFYAYVARTHRAVLDQLHQFLIYTPDQFLMLDAATQRNLELLRNTHDGSTHATLYAILDRTNTPMGSRLLRRWIGAPLINQDAIQSRHEFVAYAMERYANADTIHLYIKKIGDLERIVGRVALHKASLQDYIALKNAIASTPVLKEWLSTIPYVIAEYSAEQLVDFGVLYALLDHALYDEGVQERFIRSGYDAQLDQYRDTIEHITTRIQEFEKREQAATHISSLKVGYNNVQGYYIEVTHTHTAKVPPHYIRKQTLAGKERYVTVELQALESEIHRAQTTITEYEKQVYAAVKAAVTNYIPGLRRAAYVIAHIDVLLSYASFARYNRYVQPIMIPNSRDIMLREARHPVVEIVADGNFIANDLTMNDAASTWIITGPNMGGKSTFLRQAALIQIMAQAGSFVPAAAARLPIVDRIFTRIGAGDNVAQGKSTFLVEMEETAVICTQATEQSLVILDEVGRGTSTYDGLAIAHAVVEYLHINVRARCLFATHYHELSDLEHTIPGVVSYHATSTRTPGGIVFLYKIARGAADGSFGIEVARLAQLPPLIISRARELLAQLGTSALHLQKPTVYAKKQTVLPQINKDDKLIRMLQSVDPDNLSPRQAHEVLCSLKKVVEM